MAYRRFYRRGRNNRRRTLSNYRIATRTSARSQARQIYALKKRVSYIQRRTKPEIKTIRRTYIAPFNLNTVRGSYAIMNVLQDNSQGTNTSGPFYLIPLGDASSDSTLDVINNNFARQLSFKLTGNLAYTDAPQSNAVPFVVRIVAVQTRATRTESLGPEDIFASSGSPGIFGSLQTGLARSAKVIADKRYYLSYQRPVVRISMTIKRLLNYYRDTNNAGSSSTNESIPKGAIIIVAIWNKMSTSTEVADLPAITWNMNGKLAYTDA